MISNTAYTSSRLQSRVAATPSLEQVMTARGFPERIQSKIQQRLAMAGFESLQELTLLAKDFVDRPEVFSELLQSDFAFDALMAHRVRAVVMDVILQSSESSPSEQPQINSVEPQVHVPNAAGGSGTTVIATIGTPFDTNVESPEEESSNIVVNDDKPKKPIFKQVIVNEKAKHRKTDVADDYGLPKDYPSVYPQLAREMEGFLEFMTKPSTQSQESPIRKATAEVYVRHAKQFLGWFLHNHGQYMYPLHVSIYDIVPNKEKESAETFLEFILWLRQNRSISVSYEANILRGLTKLLKFRFARESKADPTYGEKSFDDIPLIRELRKLHRDANQRQGVAPRSSDESAKWLTWHEYLAAIQSLKSDLARLIEDYESNAPEQEEASKSTQMRKIAIVYQYYLVLAFFACVPDRQRTIRELEVGKSLVKEQGRWVIKHGPDDYKTGKTYGDRPPMMLSAELVPSIDDFLERWRPCLTPKTSKLFVQPRTGNAFTQDSVYQIVARNCYTYAGKKTNPHLLRDMIVTHVRDSDASEKQLEALALYMGHSIQMQRTSYDRRTLKRKVAPAVELLQSVNDSMGLKQ
ncbi:hypothetical protein MHU86_3836 [Fragilaria crotonensis]|nr:hypothetical protein MHU86_3836 [Fragilaria crotonensis]